jgi:hypothetical protein
MPPVCAGKAFEIIDKIGQSNLRLRSRDPRRAEGANGFRSGVVGAPDRLGHDAALRLFAMAS